MISAVSKYGAASSAIRIISTAPMAKLGAITQLLVVKAAREPVVIIGVESGRSDDCVHAVAGGPQDVVAGGRDMGEVDDDVDVRHLLRDADALDLLTDVVGIDGPGQLELGVGRDRTTHRGAHAPTGTEDTDPQHARTTYRAPRGPYLKIWAATADISLDGRVIWSVDA